MGWSWGTSIAGAYTASHDDKINRLVLYAPAWISQPPVEPSTNAIPAYRLVAKDSAKARWLRGVPKDKRGSLIFREFSTAGGMRRSLPTPLGVKWNRLGFVRLAA
jgi:pimeloyl-ACP methyl ester carboxylesterase